MNTSPVRSLLALAAAATLGSAASADLVLYYDFDNDDLSAGGITDRSLAGNDGTAVSSLGTLQAGFSTDTPAVLGGGLSLDLTANAGGGGGSRSYVEAVDAAGDAYTGILGSQDRTVSFFANRVNAGNRFGLVQWGSIDETDPANNNVEGFRWTMRSDSSNEARVEVEGAGRTSSGDVFGQNEWVHIAAVLEGDTFADVTLYVDGVAFTNTNSQPIDTQTLGTALTVGFAADAQDKWLAGKLDDVAIWDEALSEAQIQGLANGTLSPSSFVPEPGSFALLGAGLGLLAARRRRGPSA